MNGILISFVIFFGSILGVSAATNVCSINGQNACDAVAAATTTVTKISGCMDSKATNYNSAANTDNGTCVYKTTPTTPTTPVAAAKRSAILPIIGYSVGLVLILIVTFILRKRKK